MAYSGDDSILTSAVMAEDWAKQIDDRLQLNLLQLLPSISQLPEYAKNPDSESYTPQLVGLGPFHHFRPQLQGMTAVKLRFVDQALRRFNFPGDFAAFTEQVVAPLLPAIRAQYDAHLDILDSTLASAIALDSLFLVELLLCSDDDDDSIGRSTVGTVLINDVMMLENQIPLFLVHDGQALLLQSQLRRVCQQISPLHFLDGDDHVRPRRCQPRHLLEYLYFQTVGGCDSELDSSSTSSLLDVMEAAPAAALLRNLQRQHEQNAAVAEFDVFNLVSDVLQVFVGKLIKSATMRFFASAMRFSAQWFKMVERYGGTSIPTASRLTRHLGLKILPAAAAGGGGGLRAMVSFHEEEKILRLPVLTLKPNCEPLVRNLMAYESMTKPDGERVLAGYLALMCSLVRSVEDVKLLREAGVVVGGDDDEEIAGEQLRQMMPSLVNSKPFSGGDSFEFFTGKYEAARMRAMARTGLDSQIQALTHCYYSQAGAFDLGKELRWPLFWAKVLLLAVPIIVAQALVYDAVDPVRKFVEQFVSFDCLYQWPCCPHGLWPAIVSLIAGGFILNMVRALF